MSKAQVTIFMIGAIVILISVALLIGLSGNILSPSLESSSRNKVQGFVESCLRETTEKAISYVENHGGFYDLDATEATGSTLFPTAYFYFRGRDISPSIDVVEAQISYYIRDNLFICLKNFNNFPELDIVQGPVNPSSTVTSSSLIVDLDFPLKLNGPYGESSISKFRFKRDGVNLNTMLASAVNLTNEQVKTPGKLCYSCLIKQSDKYGLKIEMQNLGNDSILFLIRSRENNETLLYANRYD